MADVLTRPDYAVIVTPQRATAARKYAVEAIGTFFLVFTVGVAVLSATVGGISDGSFNPALTLGSAIGGLFGWSTLWVYFVVQFGVGSLAGLAFRAQPRPTTEFDSFQQGR